MYTYYNYASHLSKGKPIEELGTLQFEYGLRGKMPFDLMSALLKIKPSPLWDRYVELERGNEDARIIKKTVAS